MLRSGIVGVMRVLVLLLLAVGSCAPAAPAVQVTLEQPAFGTTGGNLFNCTTPSQPADRHTLTKTTIGCEPDRNGDGTFTTTPVTVTEQVGCGDGHGALVVVTCAGTGAGNAVTGSVMLALTSTCDETSAAVDPQVFAFQDVAPGAAQSSTAALDSCSVFGNLCGTSEPCAFNSFVAGISVANTSR